jgi:hypothetical protein
MNPLSPNNIKQVVAEPQKLLNKTFYKFLFSFAAVIAVVLLFILVLGVGSSGVQ